LKIPCPKCGFDLLDTILNHEDHDEMFGGNEIHFNCPNCGTKLKVWLPLEYVVEVA